MNKFIPNMYKKSIYDIDYEQLKKQNIKCLLFDLDNTCVPYKTNGPTKQLEKLFTRLKNDKFQVIIFSNSNEKRLKKFASLNVDYNSSSKKPLSHNFIKILKKYNLKKEEVCIIGDQLLTDIYGGNRVGIMTCLVDPINSEEIIYTKISRTLEKAQLKKLTKKGLLKRGNYYDKM